MVKVKFLQPDGTGDDIEAAPGDSMMTTAKANVVPGIVGDCGGGLSCATCHVFVDAEWLDVVGRRDGAEDEILEMTAVESTVQSRLSCQIIVSESHAGLVVHVPERQE